VSATVLMTRCIVLQPLLDTRMRLGLGLVAILRDVPGDASAITGARGPPTIMDGTGKAWLTCFDFEVWERLGYCGCLYFIALRI
jgi:hypothetical protein